MTQSWKFQIESKWLERYTRLGALWIHDGNPARPHAELTSGNHSSGFFNSGVVMEDPKLVREAAGDLSELLWEIKRGKTLEIDRVVGPAMGAITLAHELAHRIGEYQGRPCKTGFTEKVLNDPGKTEMKFNRIEIRPGEKVLIVEDVVTTGESALNVAMAIEMAGGVPLPYIATLVNRSGKAEISDVNGENITFVALINREMPVWKPETCPLCQNGSVALRPKGKQNWVALNATYN